MSMPETPPAPNSRICVYCGSSKGADPAHMALAKALGEAMAARNIGLVYGGGGLGLMGQTARAVRDGGADVRGIIPRFLMEQEPPQDGVKHEFVDDMHERKIRMFNLSDAFIILPGGIGTLEEVMEVMSWQRLNLHDKPIVWLSDTGYWDKQIEVLHDIMAAGFAPKTLVRDLLVATTVEEALALVAEYREKEREPQPLGKRPPEADMPTVEEVG